MSFSRKKEGPSRSRKLSEDALEHLRKARLLLGDTEEEISKKEQQARKEFANSQFNFPELHSS